MVSRPSAVDNESVVTPAVPDPRLTETRRDNSGLPRRRLAIAGRPGRSLSPGCPDGLTHGAGHPERTRAAASVTPISVAFEDREMLLRPALPHDADLMSGESGRLSAETFYRRFMTHAPPTPAMVAYLFELDYIDHFAWVMVDPVTGKAAADGRFVRDPVDSSCAEVAFTVADAYQGLGLGRLLMDAVIVAADVAGVLRLTARLFVCNAAMRSLLERFAVRWSRDEPGVMSGSFDLPGHALLLAEPALLWQIRIAAAQTVHMSTVSR